mgnify:CR=1 FL=1
MLCSSKPYEVNISKLSSAVQTSWPTLQKYLERMDAGSLIHIVRGGVGMRAVNKPDKILLSFLQQESSMTFNNVLLKSKSGSY